MHHTIAVADEDARRTMRALSADIQAALALSRATLQAIATLSPTLNAAAEDALAQELETARRAGAEHVADVLEEVRDQLQDLIPEQAARLGSLERALLAAADALPDIEADKALHA